ncbi:uncharacterized protein Z520_05331 [Fonsecaea multimorphosa CBS 102226]|uniref:Uncharacterized protein n=1 Tax=Fonsecaea multimorphosa CBS 102226 TaxID=1442371 RepID=A0A0D2HAH2_9EURO|nr:uncharacterized protein Z520_05331 [Fonsecaea multimorphosa CBS 102226]KIX98870.1 hypothetical protein Z520_05331 [Fonsecaea multimorphosa CBS 102226]
MPEVSTDISRKFMQWSYMEEPQRKVGLSFSEALELCGVAIIYRIPALQHQRSDILRKDLASKLWKLGPTEVRRILALAQPESWLRRLLGATLCANHIPNWPRNGSDPISWGYELKVSKRETHATSTITRHSVLKLRNRTSRLVPISTTNLYPADMLEEKIKKKIKKNKKGKEKTMMEGNALGLIWDEVPRSRHLK